MESKIYRFSGFEITEFYGDIELKFVLKDEIWTVIFEILSTIWLITYPSTVANILTFLPFVRYSSNCCCHLTSQE